MLDNCCKYNSISFDSISARTFCVLADIPQSEMQTIWTCICGLMGSRKCSLISSQSDLPRVFFEGDRSVEDELVCRAVGVQREVADSLKLKFIKDFCSFDRVIH